MKLSEIIKAIESLAPLALQESYDNAGLYCGNISDEISKVLVSLDITEAVVQEAIEMKCQLIIAHHPIIFKPLKKLTGENHVERTILSAIKNNIALYAAHTNLDNAYEGVNFKLAEKIGLENVQILQPTKNLKNLTVFVPLENTETLLRALSDAGAGQIGNYKDCCFKVEGTGTFTPTRNSNPVLGQLNVKEEVRENRVEVIMPSYLEKQILAAMKKAHPYEEVAHFISEVQNPNQDSGAGAIGELENGLTPEEFLQKLKKDLNLEAIRYTSFSRKINRVAVCGGAGSFLLKQAIAKNADAFVSADFKYHEYFDAENNIMIADVGHYESEFYTRELFFELLKKKFPNIAVLFSTVNTNPVKYYC
jgi:dinuclear metal center YbgI/SA1388 family protein